MHAQCKNINYLEKNLKSDNFSDEHIIYPKKKEIFFKCLFKDQIDYILFGYLFRLQFFYAPNFILF